MLSARQFAKSRRKSSNDKKAADDLRESQKVRQVANDEMFISARTSQRSNGDGRDARRKSVQWVDNDDESLFDDNSVLTEPIPPKPTRKYMDISSDSDSEEEQKITRKASTYTPPVGLPVGWVEVIDPEEPELIPVGTRVLVTDLFNPLKRYGNIASIIRYGVQYKVQLDWGEEDDLREDLKEKEREERKATRRAEMESTSVAGAAGWKDDDSDFSD